MREATWLMPLADLLATVAPGSRGDDWTWTDEAQDLWTRMPEEMHALVADLQVRGQTDPVTIGDDGRLWDGHHRVVALGTLADAWVLVRRWDQLTKGEQTAALASEMARWCNAEAPLPGERTEEGR